MVALNESPAERKAHMDEFHLPPALKESVGLRASYTETEASTYAVRQSGRNPFLDHLLL